jgi:hypothetical protein
MNEIFKNIQDKVREEMRARVETQRLVNDFAGTICPVKIGDKLRAYETIESARVEEIEGYLISVFPRVEIKWRIHCVFENGDDFWYLQDQYEDDRLRVGVSK